MTDEKYIFIQDCKDKKITARSARSTRTHCGKRGTVKFPSDYMSKKELEAMNGVCESYRLNEPVTWGEFRDWPKHIQEDYIKLITKKFNAPLSAISSMMGVHRCTLPAYVHDNELNVGKVKHGRRYWDDSGFNEWVSKYRQTEEVNEALTKLGENLAAPAIKPFNDVFSSATSEINRMVDEVNKAWAETLGNYQPIEEAHICDNEYHRLPVIPRDGSMTFTCIHADDALATIKSILCDVKVNITISWEAVE